MFDLFQSSPVRKVLLASKIDWLLIDWGNSHLSTDLDNGDVVLYQSGGSEVQGILVGD